MRPSQLMLPVIFMLGAMAQAQEFIPLSDDDVARLGLVFAPVTSPDRQSGNRFPATVINSPEAASDITVQFEGTLVQWHVMPGEPVSAGQALALLRSQEVLNLQNSWLTAQTDVEHAELILNRDTRLFEQGIISRLRLHESEHDMERANIALDSLTGMLAAAGYDEDSLMQLRENPERLGLFTLSSPGTGVLIARPLMAGQYADKYEVVGSLGGDGEPWLRASIPARYADQLSPGRVLNLAGLPQSVTLRFRDLMVHETTQTVEVLAEFDQPVDFLPGQVLNLILPPIEGGVLVPGGAVVHSGEDTVVFLRSAEGVEARVLDLEPAGSNYVASRGLRVGDQLVVQGAAVLKGIQLGLGQGE